MDMAERFVLLFVLVTNALMIFGLIYTFVRVTTTSEETRTMLTLASADLIEAGRGMHGLGEAVDRLIERLSSAERHAAALLAVKPEAPVASLDPELEGRLVAAVGPDGAGVLALRAGQQAILARLEALERRPAATSAASTVAVPADDDALRAEATAWRNRFEHLQLEAASAAERADRAESSARNLAHELTEAHQRLLRVTEGDHAAPEVALQATRSELEDLRATLAQTLETLNRTQVEKDFIEDKFLELDAASHAAHAADAAAEAAAA